MSRLVARLLVSLVFLSGSAALARIAAVGTVRGYIKDPQGGVLPGVTVTATSPTVPTPATAVSDGEGFFRLVDLAPGDYRIEAELQGFRRYVRESVGVRAGLNIALDIEMTLGGVEEVVEVVAETPLLETQKAATSVNISGELQRQLPLSSRGQFADFMEVTPGVAARAGDATGGGQIYMVRGGELENHVIQLDGADMGSFRQNRADRLLTLNTDAIGDVQVKTAAVDASVPLGSGAVINVSTRSGTDQLRGAVGVIFTPESWNGNNAGEGTVRFNEILQPDLSIGGPLVRGRLWAYGAYRYTRQTSGIGRTPEQIALLTALAPGFEPFDNAVNAHNYYVKADAQFSSRHQLMVFYENDRHPEEGNREWYGSKLFITEAGGVGVGARLQSAWSSALTTRMMASYNDKTTNSQFGVFDDVITAGPSQSVHESAFISSGRLRGTGEIALLNNDVDYGISPASKTTFQGDLTYYKAGWLGSHEFQTGLFIQALRNSNEIKYPNNGAAIEELVLRWLTDYYDNNLDGTFETSFVTPGTTEARSDRVPDPDHHQPFIDEWTLGYGRQLPGGVAVNVGFTRREYKDIPALVEINGIYDGVVFRGYADEAFNQIYLITNDRWSRYVYSGLDLSATKRAKWVQLLGGYTRGFQHVAGTWRPNDPASFIQPDAFPNDKGIGSIRGNQTNSLSGSADTRSPSWQKHNFRLGATMSTPWGAMLAVNYSYQSGAYSGPVVTRIAAADPQFGPSTVTLSNGRRVSNPLATTIRFAGATRGDDQVQLDALQNLNLRFGYDLKLGPSRSVQLALDVFNLTNQGAYEQWLDGANQQYSPNYGLGRALQFPRVLQISARFGF